MDYGVCTNPKCAKRPQMAYHKPHSLHRTKRIVLPNLQKFKQQYWCSRCIRTATKKGA